MFTRREYVLALSMILVLALLTSGLANNSVQRAGTLQRPLRQVVKPEMIRIEAPVFTVDNKPTVDMRPEITSLGIPVRSQGGRGTCSVFAMTFLLDFMYAKNYGFKNSDLSEEYLNYASNLAIGQQVDGGFFDQLDKGYQKYGIVNEALLPYLSMFNPNLKVSPATLTSGSELSPRLKPPFIKEWDVTTGLQDS